MIGRRGVTSSASVVADAIAWDVRNWAKALDFWTLRTRIPLNEARVLEVGVADNGGLSLWFAANGADVVSSGLRT